MTLNDYLANLSPGQYVALCIILILLVVAMFVPLTNTWDKTVRRVDPPCEDPECGCHRDDEH